MKREQKVERTTGLAERLKAAKLALLTDYRGLTAGQLDRLRRQVRDVAGECRVAKNTLARRVITEPASGEVTRLLAGPTAFVFAFRDPVAVAKVVVKFAAENEALAIKGAVLEGEYLGPEGVRALAELPSREVLLGRLLGVLQGPAVRLLGVLREPGVRVVRVLDAVRRQRDEASPEAAVASE
jgi:large subunit ribosomal protein L10